MRQAMDARQGEEWVCKVVTRAGNGTRQRSSPNKRVKYFYLNSDLHKVLRIIRAQDFVEAWSYPEAKRKGYVWSDVRKRMETAVPLAQVATLIGRHRVQIENYILNGHIKTPQRIYTLDGEKKPGKYMFSESDVMDLHDYLLTVHIGRPRKDGLITPGRMPTKSELRAMMRHDTVTYVKTHDGEFTPVWREVDW
jgi:hypothetical protein